jgi:hypothetical protein
MTGKKRRTSVGGTLASRFPGTEVLLHLSRAGRRRVDDALPQWRWPAPKVAGTLQYQPRPPGT